MWRSNVIRHYTIAQANNLIILGIQASAFSPLLCRHILDDGSDMAYNGSAVAFGTRSS